MKKWLPFLITLSVVSGCSLLTSPNSYDKNNDVDGSVDVADGGPDLRQPDVTSACVCSEPAPYCDEAEARCVACLDNSHCPGDEQCRSGACSECVDSTECTTPEAPLCASDGPSAGRCVPCTGEASCEGVSVEGDAVPVCHEEAGQPNVCVECDGEDQCAPFVCDVQANQCTAIPTGRAIVCASCVSSEQCSDDRVCAQEIFNGEPTGFFCLPRAALGCVDRVRDHDFWMSVEGETVEVCHPAATTCAGLLGGGRSCMDASTCGLPDIDDSMCVDDRCKYYCSDAADCAADEVCDVAGTMLCVPE